MLLSAKSLYHKPLPVIATIRCSSCTTSSW